MQSSAPEAPPPPRGSTPVPPCQKHLHQLPLPDTAGTDHSKDGAERAANDVTESWVVTPSAAPLFQKKIFFVPCWGKGIKNVEDSFLST